MYTYNTFSKAYDTLECTNNARDAVAFGALTTPLNQHRIPNSPSRTRDVATSPTAASRLCL
jgi:hypothetical protein